MSGLNNPTSDAAVNFDMYRIL